MIRKIALVCLVMALAGCSDDSSTTPSPDENNQADQGVTTDMGDTQDLGENVSDMRRVDTGPGEDLGAVDMPPDIVEIETTVYLYALELDGVLHRYLVNDDGTVEPPRTVTEGGRATFGAFDPTSDRLYTTNASAVDGYTLSEADGPTFIGTAPVSVGGTHLEVDKTGQYVFVASYGNDALAMLPIAEDGSPEPFSELFGSDQNQNFCQNAHQVRVHSNNRFVYVPCLGSNHIARLSFDASDGSLTMLDPISTADGMGPRHMDFHPSLQKAYVLGELNSTIEVFDVDDTNGNLSRIQTVSTVPEGVDPSASSDIHITADGRFIYAINRQPRHEIVWFPVDESGRLGDAKRIPTGGEHARTFALHPDGNRLFVGNSNSQDITTFSIAADGALSQTDVTIDGFSSRLFWVDFREVPVE